MVALLAGGALQALRIHTERSRFLEARAMLVEAREALLNHAAAVGSLPCPDLDDDGDPDSCANGAAHAGRLPWRLLALPARDPWGQPLNYMLSPAFASGRAIALASLGNIRIRQTESGGDEGSLANEGSVALALWSSGPNGRQDAHRGGNLLVANAPDTDDPLTWLSRFLLIGRMLEAGRPL